LESEISGIGCVIVVYGGGKLLPEHSSQNDVWRV